MNIVNKINELKWHDSRRWGTRSLSKINKIVLHQELGEGTLEAVNNYHVSPNHISPKGCPHICYHYGIRKNGEIVQCNELTSVTWHCKGQNTSGIGIMLVGDFPGPGHDIGKSQPTKEQLASMGELVGYLQKKFNLTNQAVYGHYHFGKPACPGFVVEEWIEKYRNNMDPTSTAVPVEKTAVEIQKRLAQLGYDVGPADGIVGQRTKAAIYKFQKDNALDVDGVVGPQTWNKLLYLTQ